jgi:hypothetical protein
VKGYTRQVDSKQRQTHLIPKSKQKTGDRQSGKHTPYSLYEFYMMQLLRLGKDASLLQTLPSILFTKFQLEEGLLQSQLLPTRSVQSE